jgi:hypothetical protein
MKIRSSIHTLPFPPGASLTGPLQRYIAEQEPVLRWGLIGHTHRSVHLEISHIEGSGRQAPCIGWSQPARRQPAQARKIAALVVPTGVGAAIGGFIGDAGPIARVLESVLDCLLVHPNVVNAGSFYGGGPRSTYVDGLTLDRFFAGATGIATRRGGRIGVILDAFGPGDTCAILNTVNGLASVYGAQFTGYYRCKEKIVSSIQRSDYGHFTGQVENPDEFLEAAQAMKHAGADAIAIVTAIGGYSEQDIAAHYHGSPINPVGALEALVSRAVTWHTDLPCAHAPHYERGLGQAHDVIDPRAAAEVASRTGLPCLIRGLTQCGIATDREAVHVSDLAAIILPAGCAGGIPTLGATQAGVAVIAVHSNLCHVGVPAEVLGAPNTRYAATYAEALAMLCCMQAGVGWQAFCGSAEPVLELAIH